MLKKHAIYRDTYMCNNIVKRVVIAKKETKLFGYNVVELRSLKNAE